MLDAAKKKFLLWLMQTGAYRWALIDGIPQVRFSTGMAKVQGWQYAALHAAMEPSDILLAIDRNNLAGKLITGITKGRVSHAAGVVAKGGAWEVSEMTQVGYTQSALFDVCKHADRVILATCSDWDSAYKRAVVEKMRTFIGTKYDINFSLGVEFLACSELIYHSDFEHRLQVDLVDEAGIGQPYISPEGILQAKNLVIKLDTDSMLVPSLVLAAA